MLYVYQYSYMTDTIVIFNCLLLRFQANEICKSFTKHLQRENIIRNTQHVLVNNITMETNDSCISPFEKQHQSQHSRDWSRNWWGHDVTSQAQLDNSLIGSLGVCPPTISKNGWLMVHFSVIVILFLIKLLLETCPYSSSTITSTMCTQVM